MGYTKGSWKVNFAQHRGGYTVDNESSSLEIASVGERANARLIAAAPDLLAVAKDALALLEVEGRGDSDYAADLRRAIAAAEEVA